MLVLMAWCTVSFCVGQDSSAKGSDLPEGDVYETRVKPILVAKCYGCHGADEQKSGLRLDSSSGILAGGDSGPSIVPGKPAESLLIQAIQGVGGVSKMPPKGPQLTNEEIQVIQEWVKSGARISAEPETVAPRVIKNRDHWSFQPVVRHSLPASTLPGWSQNEIDAFVLQKLQEKQLLPSPEADRETLIRRVTLDLIGLPPTPAEIDAFLTDTSGMAFERVVDRLLNSPHYGERMARQWLDLARYADSNGFTRDQPRVIWKYRDWVIQAYNRNLSFDQFAITQIAGDMLPNASIEDKVATGFHRNTLFNEEGGTDPEQFRVESVVDRVSTTGTVFLGLTLGCAQCHDHKYDPLTQREFYQVFAFFNNADEPKLEVPSPEQVAAGAMAHRDQLRETINALEKQFANQKSDFEAELAAWGKTVTEEQKTKLPILVTNALNLSLSMRTEENTKPLMDYFKGHEIARKKFPVLEEITRLKSQEPVFVTTLVMQERVQPRETHVQIRGDFLRLGVKVSPGVPAVLPGLAPGPALPNRLDFAKWLVSPVNPLTPRVTVNRLWQKFFGRGLVETENDFGLQGTPPTHPELLDWLAADFISSGWDLKQIQRKLVLSGTYRQSSRQRPDIEEVDPQNRLYARQSRIRLDAELIRDVALASSGLFSPVVGGPSVYPPQPEGVFDFTQDKKPWIPATGSDRFRRGMYTYLWRSSPYPAMTVFDFPDANIACTRRSRSNTPLQSLTLANDATFIEFAQGLARRMLTESAAGDESRVETAFRWCLGRKPQEMEKLRVLKFLEDQRQLLTSDSAQKVAPGPLPAGIAVTEAAAWTGVARVLLNLDEFITRE